MENTLFPALFEGLDRAFPEFRFRRQGPTRWTCQDEGLSRTLAGSPRPDRVEVYRNSAYGFTVHGVGFTTWQSYLTQGARVQGEEFRRLIADLSRRAAVPDFFERQELQERHVRRFAPKGEPNLETEPEDRHDGSEPMPKFRRQEVLRTLLALCQETLASDAQALAYVQARGGDVRGLAAAGVLGALGGGDAQDTACDIDRTGSLGLGLYPGSSQTVRQYLNARGFSADEMRRCGVVFDRMQGHLVFPWFDMQGALQGLWSRRVDPLDQQDQQDQQDQGPKSLGLPGQSKPCPLFMDRLVGAGDVAPRSGKSSGSDGSGRTETLVLVEGPFDALHAQQAGYRHVVCLTGTTLTASMRQALVEASRGANPVRRVVLALDSDDAGRTATAKIARQLLGLGIQPYHADLQGYDDPDGFVRRHPGGVGAFMAVCAGAVHWLRGEVDRLLAQMMTATPDDAPDDADAEHDPQAHLAHQAQAIARFEATDLQVQQLVDACVAHQTAFFEDQSHHSSPSEVDLAAARFAYDQYFWPQVAFYLGEDDGGTLATLRAESLARIERKAYLATVSRYARDLQLASMASSQPTGSGEHAGQNAASGTEPNSALSALLATPPTPPASLGGVGGFGAGQAAGFLDNARHYSLAQAARELSRAAQGLATGLPAIDARVRLPVGGISVVAGRPSHGKTTVMLNLLVQQLRQARDGGRVALFSYEEARSRLLAKLLLILADGGFCDARARSGPTGGVMSAFDHACAFLSQASGTLRDDAAVVTYPEKCWLAYDQLDAWLSGGQLILSDDAVDAGTLALGLARLADEPMGLRACFVDYIQKLPAPPGTRAQGARYLEIKAASDALLRVVVDHNLVCVVGAQFGRPPKGGGTTSPVRLENLRESGDIEQDANLVLGLYNPVIGRSVDDDNAEDFDIDSRDDRWRLYVLKNRNGEAAGPPILLNFNGPSLRLSSVSSQSPSSSLI